MMARCILPTANWISRKNPGMKHFFRWLEWKLRGKWRYSHGVRYGEVVTVQAVISGMDREWLHFVEHTENYDARIFVPVDDALSRDLDRIEETPVMEPEPVDV